MREPRVYTEQTLESEREIELQPGAAQHLTQVLRLGVGAPLRLFNGDGREFQARLSAAGKAGVRVEVLDLVATEDPARLPLNLYLGVSKGERMDFAIQKAVELGVTRIRPLFSTRSVVQLTGGRLQRRLEHWRGVINSACEQCGRNRLPELEHPHPLPKVLVEQASADCRLVLHHGAETSLDRVTPPETAVDLLVGPEGGLAPGELELARSEGFTPLRLGPRIMRTETAPLAALAAIQTLWGDYRSPDA